jgi:hypothetical protein
MQCTLICIEFRYDMTDYFQRLLFFVLIYMINKHIFFFLEQSTLKEIKFKKYVKIFLTFLGYSVASLPTISFCCQHAFSF